MARHFRHAAKQHELDVCSDWGPHSLGRTILSLAEKERPQKSCRRCSGYIMNSVADISTRLLGVTRKPLDFILGLDGSLEEHRRRYKLSKHQGPGCTIIERFVPVQNLLEDDLQKASGGQSHVTLCGPAPTQTHVARGSCEDDFQFATTLLPRSQP